MRGGQDVAFGNSANGFSRLSLNGRDGNGVNDILRFAAAGKIVGRTVQALQNRADGRRPRQTLSQFVRDVAGLQVGKDEHVGATRDRRPRRFRLTDVHGKVVKDILT